GSLALPDGVVPGSRLMAVNDTPFAEYVSGIEPYHCYSTPTFFWYHLPHHLVRQGSELPHHRERLKLTFETIAGPAGVDLAYGDPSSFSFPTTQRYAGWTLAAE